MIDIDIGIKMLNGENDRSGIIDSCQGFVPIQLQRWTS